jgi:RimJ/RimL family protein N-acetyltransferase
MIEIISKSRLVPETTEDFPDLGSLNLVTTRALNVEDATAFRTLRLETLQFYGEIFANYRQEMEKKPLEFWREFCTETGDRCLFGLFILGKLTGVMGAQKWDEDNTGKTTLWSYSYLRPEYRGRGLAASLYQSREKWTKENSRFERAVFYIREESLRSRQIHEKHGAHYLYTKQMQWYDGPWAPWRWYEKQLS